MTHELSQNDLNLIGLARICIEGGPAAARSAEEGPLGKDGDFSWSWPLDEDVEDGTLVRIHAHANDNQIVKQGDVTWIRPNRIVILLQRPDGTVFQRLERLVRPEPVAVEADGSPRVTLARLITRQVAVAVS